MLGPGVEHLVGDCHDAALVRQRAAELHPVAVGAQRADVDGREVRRLRPVGGETGRDETVEQAVALGFEVGGDARVELVGQPQADRDRRLERGGVDIGQELLRGSRRGDHRCRPARPADLPAGRVEGLAARRDGHGPIGHPRQRRHRDMRRTREHEMLVHLVGHHEQIVIDRQLGDERQLVAREHLAGRVVRCVQQDQLRPRRDRCRAARRDRTRSRRRSVRATQGVRWHRRARCTPGSCRTSARTRRPRRRCRACRAVPPPALRSRRPSRALRCRDRARARRSDAGARRSPIGAPGCPVRAGTG